jgi:hypothetical protein
LVGLLDDVAALAKLAAASIDDVGAAAGRASVKAAGVVVDDTAVTPSYVQGLAADRELLIVKAIAAGSLRNKLLFILPVGILFSTFAPLRAGPRSRARRQRRRSGERSAGMDGRDGRVGHGGPGRRCGRRDHRVADRYPQGAGTIALVTGSIAAGCAMLCR